MKEQLEKYLTEIAQLIEQGGAFALEQLPLFVQEYLAYYTWFHLIVSIPLVIYGVYSVYVWFQFNSAEKWEPEELLFSTLLWVFGGGLPLSFGVAHLLQALKITIAPRVYLIENLTTLLGS